MHETAWFLARGGAEGVGLLVIWLCVGAAAFVAGGVIGAMVGRYLQDSSDSYVSGWTVVRLALLGSVVGLGIAVFLFIKWPTLVMIPFGESS